jgi:hypothetical protein
MQSKDSGLDIMTEHQEHPASGETIHGQPSKRKYRRPMLVAYGRMRELTASGSTPEMENPGMSLGNHP